MDSLPIRGILTFFRERGGVEFREISVGGILVDLITDSGVVAPFGIE